MPEPKVSIIISARNEEIHLKKTLDLMLERANYDNFEIIVVNDGSTDGSEKLLATYNSNKVKTLKAKGIGTAKARNLGFRFARCEIVVFSDAHITVEDNWLPDIVRAYNEANFDVLAIPIKPDGVGIGNPSNIGYAQTLSEMSAIWICTKPEKNYVEVPLAAGGFVAYKKEVFDSIGGYQELFNTWGYEDIEISIRAWLLGFKTILANDFSVGHYFREAVVFPVTMLDFCYNQYLSAILHFSDQNIQKAIEHITKIFYDLHYKNEIIQMTSKKLPSEIIQKRNHYLRTRKYSDEWFFNYFNINF